MAENAAKNPYIVNALETLQGRDYSYIQNKIRQEGKDILPNVITLAFVLEKMTSTMNENWRFLKACNEIWTKHDDLNKIKRIVLPTEGGIFKLAKVVTVEEFFKRLISGLETLDIRKVTPQIRLYNPLF